MSAGAEIVVIRFAEGWTLLARSGRWGRYASSEQAERAGRRIQNRELGQGRECLLLLQDASGRLRPADI